MREPHAGLARLHRFWVWLLLAGLACGLTARTCPSQAPTNAARAPAALGPPQKWAETFPTTAPRIVRGWVVDLAPLECVKTLVGAPSARLLGPTFAGPISAQRSAHGQTLVSGGRIQLLAPVPRPDLFDGATNEPPLAALPNVLLFESNTPPAPVFDILDFDQADPAYTPIPSILVFKSSKPALSPIPSILVFDALPVRTSGIAYLPGLQFRQPPELISPGAAIFAEPTVVREELLLTSVTDLPAFGDVIGLGKSAQAGESLADGPVTFLQPLTAAPTSEVLAHFGIPLQAMDSEAREVESTAPTTALPFLRRD